MILNDLMQRSIEILVYQNTLRVYHKVSVPKDIDRRATGIIRDILIDKGQYLDILA